MDIKIRDNGIADGREYYWALCSPCNTISPVAEWPELMAWLAQHYRQCQANKMRYTEMETSAQPAVVRFAHAEDTSILTTAMLDDVFGAAKKL